jgi:hypothetical protein
MAPSIICKPCEKPAPYEVTRKSLAHTKLFNFVNTLKRLASSIAVLPHHLNYLSNFRDFMFL